MAVLYKFAEEKGIAARHHKITATIFLPCNSQEYIYYIYHLFAYHISYHNIRTILYDSVANFEDIIFIFSNMYLIVLFT